MYAFLMRLFFFFSLFWYFGRLLKRFLGGMPRRVDPKTTPGGGPANYTVKDPVCGMYLDPHLALRTEVDKAIFHFCSEKCRTQFMSNPGQFGPAAEGKSGSEYR
jgi:YHS domain-containing protein